MSKTVRLSIRLDPVLKQTLVERSQITGIPVSRLVIQALETYLTQGSDPITPPSDPLKITELERSIQTLQQRLEQVEANLQLLLQPSPELRLPDPVFTARLPSEPATGLINPLLWDPLQASFEDWVFQSWMALATQQAGSEDCWGQIIAVEVLHERSFYDMRLPRFVDRLMAAEVSELELISDPPGIGCRPVALTYHWDNQQLPEGSKGLTPLD